MNFVLISNLEELDSFLKSIEPKLDESAIERETESYKKLKNMEIPYIYDLSHFSRITGFSIKQLNFFIYSKHHAYRTFEIPKKSGDSRVIDAPNYSLKKLQRWILENILIKIRPGDYSHGFIRNRSIVTNSQIHIGKELVYNLDLENFFPSIKMRRAKGFFFSIGFNIRAADFLAELCTYRFSLPQGAPTSPMISNLIAWRLDQRLAKLCKKHDMDYTRYADDLTISGSSKIPRYKKLIFRIIEEEGFKVNLRKVRLRDNGSSQKVTGLVVNDKVSLGRQKKKNFLAMIHNILKNGPIFENRFNNPFFKEKLLGDIGFFNMVDPDFASKCYEQFHKIDWSDYDRQYDHTGMTNLGLRFLKESKTNVIHFKELEIFQNVDEIPESHWTTDFFDWLDRLREKCNEQSNENCADCIHKPISGYKDCIKYILSHYTHDTGGAHHGHEVCDLLTNTKYNGESVFVAFLAKSGKVNGRSKDTLIRQYLDCIEIDEIHVLSVTTNGTIDNKLQLRLIRYMKKLNPHQKLCIIMRNEMAMLLYTFDKQGETPS